VKIQLVGDVEGKEMITLASGYIFLYSSSPRKSRGNLITFGLGSSEVGLKLPVERKYIYDPMYIIAARNKEMVIYLLFITLLTHQQAPCLREIL